MAVSVLDARNQGWKSGSGHSYSGAPTNSKPADATAFILAVMTWDPGSHNINTYHNLSPTVGGVAIPRVDDSWTNTMAGSKSVSCCVFYLDDLSGLSGEALSITCYQYKHGSFSAAWLSGTGELHATDTVKNTGRLGGYYGTPSYSGRTLDSYGTSDVVIQVMYNWYNNSLQADAEFYVDNGDDGGFVNGYFYNYSAYYGRININPVEVSGVTEFGMRHNYNDYGYSLLHAASAGGSGGGKRMTQTVVML